MKKNIFKVIIFGILAIGLSGCSREEADLFKYTAAQRMEMEVDSAKTMLETAPNGWEMLYFIDGKKTGYNMLVKFNANSSVTVAAKNALITSNKYLTDESFWSVIDDNGPVLTFNTYNDVLHAYSNPQNDGVGNGGDYEFIVISATHSQIKLKGKKNGAYVCLNRLEDNQDWKSYFADVEAMQNKLFSNNNTLDFKIDNVFNKAYYGSTGIFTIVKAGEDPTSETALTCSFVTTQKGIFLFEALKNGSIEARDFILDKAQSKLEGTGVDFIINDINTYFYDYTSKNSGWSINISDVNPTMIGYINTVNSTLKSLGGSKSSLQSLKIIYSESRKCYVLRLGYMISGDMDEQDFDFNFTVQNGKILLSRKGTQSDGATVLLTVNGIEDVVKSVEGVYSISSVYPINPTLGVKLVSDSNSGTWFKMTGFSK